MKTVTLDGDHLTLEEVLEIAEGKARVRNRFHSGEEG